MIDPELDTPDFDPDDQDVLPLGRPPLCVDDDLFDSSDPETDTPDFDPDEGLY